MSETASQLLATFESLPSKEQHELLVAMLKIGGQLPSGDVPDDALTSVADEIFLRLDAEEANETAT